KSSNTVGACPPLFAATGAPCGTGNWLKVGTSAKPATPIMLMVRLSSAPTPFFFFLKIAETEGAAELVADEDVWWSTIECGSCRTQNRHASSTTYLIADLGKNHSRGRPWSGFTLTKQNRMSQCPGFVRLPNSSWSDSKLRAGPRPVGRYSALRPGRIE